MFHKQTLPNGLRIITAPLADTKAVTVLIMFAVGSRYEVRSVSGVSHFLEHLFFKGTENRPSALEISRVLDSVGAEFNAFTSKDYTGYYMKLTYKKFELALDILSDILLHSLFDPNEIERERGVITEEINMYNDNPIMAIEERFERLMYGDTPLGWSIAGTKEIIKKISRDEILAYRKGHYHAENAIVGVSGKLPKNADTLIKKYFGGNAFQKKPTIQAQEVNIVQQKPRIDVHYKKTEQVQLILGWPGFHYTHKNFDALKILMIILGGNMSSRLFISIREKKGLCYFIRASLSPFADIGHIMIHAGLDKKRTHEAITAILDEISLVIAKGVTEDEVQKAKDYIKGKTTLSLEDSEELISWGIQQELFHKKLVTPEERFSQLDKVASSAVHKVAKELFISEYTNLALIGPFHNGASFESQLHF